MLDKIFQGLMTLGSTGVIAFIIVLIVIAFVGIIIKKRKESMYDTALFYVSLAEEVWGSKLGKIKFVEVITNLRKRYPIITIFIKEDVLTDLIERALIDMKEILRKAEIAKKKELEKK